MTPPTLAEQAAECEREWKMRDHVYARWVKAGKMKEAEAQRGIARMRAAAATLRGLADEEATKGDLFGG